MYFFFFKQKTAYEMRISDWSSDVCSSDLDQAARHRRLPHPRFAHDEPLAQCSRDADPQFEHRHRADRRPAWPREDGGAFPRSRSEEHTSELQSLMRISYAVFCLKKKKNKSPNTTSALRRK